MHFGQSCCSALVHILYYHEVRLLQSLPKQLGKKTLFFLLLFHLINHPKYTAWNFTLHFFRLPTWTIFVRKYDHKTWRRAIQQHFRALKHFVMAHIAGGKGERKTRKRGIFSRVLAEIVANLINVSDIAKKI